MREREEGDVTGCTHTCLQTAWQWMSTSCVVLTFLGDHKWFTSGESRGFASEEQYVHNPACCYVSAVGC